MATHSHEHLRWATIPMYLYEFYDKKDDKKIFGIYISDILSFLGRPLQYEEPW